MTKKELVEMLAEVPDDANIKISGVNDSMLGRHITYASINGYIKLTDVDYVLTDMNVKPRIL